MNAASKSHLSATVKAFREYKPIILPMPEKEVVGKVVLIAYKPKVQVRGLD